MSDVFPEDCGPVSSVQQSVKSSMCWVEARVGIILLVYFQNSKKNLESKLKFSGSAKEFKRITLSYGIKKSNS